MRSLGEFDIVRVRAENPGPLTLSGTNSWVVGRDPAFIVDPGPALEAHVEALVAAIEARGGLGGVAITHDHLDHTGGLAALLARCGPAPVGGGGATAAVQLTDGTTFGPLQAVGTPGHAPEHLAFVAGAAAFTGDAVLGEGSVFIAPDPGALTGYLDGLRRLATFKLAVLCPGHGPPIWETRAKLDEYVSHRLDRERRLLAALAGGARSIDDLLDSAWSDAPPLLRPAATLTLAAHLDKLEEEGRLPDGVQRPAPWG
jgi:glyoxylase-like metal-dependent hydrolase (beta-lactamase superfamily II)